MKLPYRIITIWLPGAVICLAYLLEAHIPKKYYVYMNQKAFILSHLSM